MKNSFSTSTQDKLIKGGSHLAPGIQSNTFFGIFDFFNKVIVDYLNKKREIFLPFKIEKEDDEFRVLLIILKTCSQK